MTKRYLFVAGLRDLLGLERVVNDGDYGYGIAEVAEELKEVWAISGGRGTFSCPRGRYSIAALGRRGSHFQEFLWTGVVKSKIG